MNTFSGWLLFQLDVNNAFLRDHISEDVYMTKPFGFIDEKYPSYVCKLKKALHGLKHAHRAWYNELNSYMCSIGFLHSKSDASLFIYSMDGVYLLYLVWLLFISWVLDFQSKI